MRTLFSRVLNLKKERGCQPDYGRGIVADEYSQNGREQPSDKHNLPNICSFILYRYLNYKEAAEKLLHG